MEVDPVGQEPAMSTVTPASTETTRKQTAILFGALAGILGVYLAIGDRGKARAYDAGHRHNACIANLRQIQGAKETWMLEKEKTTNDIPADGDLFGETQYIRRKPTCPDGGVYSIGRVGENPKCSFKGHGLGQWP